MTKNKVQNNNKTKDLLKAYTKGELKSVKDLEKAKKRYAQIARNTLKKNKSITIRLAERDLLRLKEKAMKEGVPYQTLISSLIHKNVS
jgi:predicted DNA binding CopG/RHH family protein